MISLKQLNYALAVARSLQFKKAAQACHISQSALSTALQELERQLGVSIFERDTKKVLITPMGQQVLQRARLIMQQVNELEQFAHLQQEPFGFPLTLGAIPTIAPYLLPRLFPALYQQYPQAQIKIVEEQSQVLIDWVRTGVIDTAILALPYPCEGLLSLEFWQEDFYWVALNSQTPSQLSQITHQQIQQQELLLLKEGHCLKDHIAQACKLSAQHLQPNFAVTSLATLIQMVLARLGTTLVPAMALESLVLPHQQLRALHLNEPGPHRRLAFILRPNYTRTRAIETLMQLCCSSLGERPA